MKCVTCSSTDSSLLKLQTYVDNNTLKEISVVLPDFEIPAAQGPVYVCVTCQEQVSTFCRIKRASLKNLYHLNHYEDILKTTSDVKYNNLKIIIDHNKTLTKRDQVINFKLNKISSDNENQLIEKDFNLSDGEESQNHNSSKKKVLKCGDCNKTFTCRSNLRRHVRVHTGAKPYVCTTCQKTFTTSSTLNRHTLIHTGDKPYGCDICHKTFSRADNLIAHKLYHSNVRPHQCGVCTKAFTQTSDLTEHMRIHTGEKPHQCHVCQHKFTRAAHLKRHIRTHTGKTQCQ